MTIPHYGTPEHAALITRDRHPGVQTAMAWLCDSHLPPTLKTLSRPTYTAAVELLERVPNDSAELTSALNRLVEAKDWFVRAGIHSDLGKPGPVPRPATVVDPPVPPTDFAVVDPMGDPFQDGPSVMDNRIGPNFGRPIQDRPQA
jgi:hypothetical protein